MQSIDNGTGEVLAPRMPPEIAEAVFKVKAGIKQLGFDEDNKHAGYKYTSVDKFYTAIRPLEAEAGLEVMLDETGFDVRAGDSGKGWLFINYDVWLLHRTGIMWGPLRRHIAMPVTGPQAFGAAESYILKAFRRGFYMVPTGEKDADDTAPRDDAPTARAAAPQTQGKLRQHLSGGNGASAPPTDARKHYRRIQGEIDNARTFDDLNTSGVFGPEAEEAKALIEKERGGAEAWKLLVERDTSRRMIIAGAEGDIVA